MNKEELKELKSIITTNNITSELEIQKIIKEKWNTDYTNEGIKNLLKTQFNFNLNETKHSLDELTTNIQNHIKELTEISISKNDDLNTLIFIISREKNSEVLKKLIYLLLRTIGFKNNFSSKLLSITTATGNNWLKIWKKYGYSGLIGKKVRDEKLN